MNSKIATVPTTQYLTPKQIYALKLLSAKTKKRMSVIVREALDEYLGKEKNEK